MSQMFAHIAKTDGIGGLYRGVRNPPPLLFARHYH